MRRAQPLEPGLSTVYLPIEDMIATAIDQAVRLANSEPVAPIPPFTGTLILRESVAAGPFFNVRPNDALQSISSANSSSMV